MLGVEYNELRFAEFLDLTMDHVFNRYCLDMSLYEGYRDEFMRIVNSDAYPGAEPFPESRHVLEGLRFQMGGGESVLCLGKRGTR